MFLAGTYLKKRFLFYDTIQIPDNLQETQLIDFVSIAMKFHWLFSQTY